MGRTPLTRNAEGVLIPHLPTEEAAIHDRGLGAFMGYNRSMKKFLAVALLCAATVLAAPKPKKSQTQPDSKRIAEIQKALAEHGFPPGTNWKETRESCRRIADDHGWQNMWAPDARVLAVLGLAPSVSLTAEEMKPNQLDAEERKWVEEHGGEAAREAQ